MGMFDSFYSFDARTPLSCAAGHPLLREDFQTKDFDQPNMDSYYLYEGRLFRLSRRSEEEPRDERIEPAGEAVILIVNRRAESVSFSGTVNIYTHCHECAPILYESEYGGGLWGDLVSERRPRVEYRLIFRNGRLEAVERVKIESREDVRKNLREVFGERVIADDDRLARRHFELLKKGQTMY